MVSKRKVACTAGMLVSGIVLAFSLAILTENGFEDLLDSPYSLVVVASVAGLFVSGVLYSQQAKKPKDVSVNSPSVSKSSPVVGSVGAVHVPVLSGTRFMNDGADTTLYSDSHAWLVLPEGYSVVFKEASTSIEPQNSEAKKERRFFKTAHR